MGKEENLLRVPLRETTLVHLRLLFSSNSRLSSGDDDGGGGGGYSDSKEFVFLAEKPDVARNEKRSDLW